MLSFSHKHSKIISLSFIALAIAVVYSNTLRCEFLFDSRTKILQNVFLTSPRYLWTLLSTNNRPFTYLTFAFNYLLGGVNVVGYHILNILIHICAALTLWGVIYRTCLRARLRERYRERAGMLAAAGALLWAVHPLQTESVTYIFQRSESLVGLFYLLTLYCLIRYLEANERKWQWLAITASFLGMATKPVMGTAPVIMLLYDRIFFAESFREIFARRKKLYFGFAASWILFLLIILQPQESPFGVVGDLIQKKGLTPFLYARSQPGIILHYLKLCFWPRPLILDYQWPVANSFMSVVPPFIGILFLLALTIWALRRVPALGFLGVWFFLILAPTSSFMTLEDLAFEHRMYVPLAAVIMLVVFGADRLFARLVIPGKGQHRLFCSTIGICAVLLGVATFQRNQDYQDRISMWQTVLAYKPGHFRANYNVGLAYFERGDHEKAQKRYEKAIQIKPDYERAHNNLGGILYEKNQFAEAEYHWQEALRVAPDYAEAHSNYAVLLMDQQKFDEAKEHLLTSIRLFPYNPAVFKNLGNLYYIQNKLEAAIEPYRRALEMSPTDTYLMLNLGTIQYDLGDFMAAKEYFKKALEYDMGNPVLYNSLGAASLQTGALKEAIFYFEQAVRLAPDYENARNNLAIAVEHSQKQFPEPRAQSSEKEKPVIAGE